MEVDDIQRNDDTDDDPVVSEIPVYLNHLQDPPHLCGEIYVILNTLRQNSRPYGDQGRLTSVELDDENSRLRLNYSVNTRADTYDSSSSHPLRAHSLVAKPMPRDSSGGSHCIGIAHDGMLTLVPVSATCTSRPSLEHVDVEAASRKTSSSPGKGEEGTESKPLTGKALHYQQLVKSIKIPRSNWKELDHYDHDSVEAADLLHEHILVSGGGKMSDDMKKMRDLKLRDLEFVPSNPHDFLTALTSGKARSEDTSSSINQAHAELSRLDFGRQIEAITRRNQVSKFSDLMTALPANTRARFSQPEVLAHLDHCCLFVQGNWVVLSHLSGLRPQLWDTRDALLILLHAERDVTVQLLSGISNLPKEDIEDVLRGVCSLDLLTNTWKLKLREDKEFAQTHPEIVQRHSAIANSIIQRLKAKKERVTAQAGSATSSGGASQTSRSFTPEETQAMMEIARAKLVDQGALSTDEVRQTLQAQTRDHYVSESCALEVLRLVEAIPVRDRWAIASRGSEDVLRLQLIALYKDRDALTKPEILAAFNKVLGRTCDLTDHDLRKLIKEFARNERGYWVFNGEPIAERRIKTVKDEVDDIVMS